MTAEKKRANYLTMEQQFSLHFACALINKAYDEMGFGCYLVGSCMRTGLYRDVDVRYIMHDEWMPRVFPRITDDYMLHPLWTLHTQAIGTWLSRYTGLPIDFQFQSQTFANTKFADLPRSSLGHFHWDYPK